MDHISIKSINDQSAHTLPINLEGNKCPLCAEATDLPLSRLKRHYEMLHGKHYVTLGDQVALLCKLNCDDKIRNESHYHCSNTQCFYLSRQKDRMLAHFQKHIPTINPGSDDVNISLVNIQPNVRLRCVMVDEQKGTYLVSKQHTGRNIPVHVVKNLQKRPYALQCFEAACQEAMRMAKMNGIHNFECPHLQNVVSLSTPTKDLWFDDITIQDRKRDLSERNGIYSQRCNPNSEVGC